MLHFKNLTQRFATSILIIAILFIPLCLYDQSSIFLIALIALAVSIEWTVLSIKLKLSKFFMTLGYIYIFLSCIGLNKFLSTTFLNFFPNIFNSSLASMAIISSFSDSSAFIAGNIIGGKKIVPKISPNKTISGSVTGVLFPAMVLSFVANNQLSILTNFVLISILCVLSSAGDLFESFIKRLLKIKDSSNILPGHGGILDRFDSLMGIGFGLFIYYCVFKLLNFIPWIF